VTARRPQEELDVDRLHAVVHEGRGPFALLVHGALGSRSYWADNVEALSAVCRPVVVELWGHGRSPSPADPGRYGPESYTAEFEHLRAELGAEAWITIGQSMGAGLTLHYGLRHPERVLAQVVTNSSSAFSPPDRWRHRQETEVVPLADQIREEGVDLLRDHWVNPGRSRRIAEATRALLAAEFDEHETHGIAESLATTNGLLPLGERLAEVALPTLLTLGVDEEPFLALVERARAIAGLEVVEIAGSHAVNAHDPDGWNRAVVDFVRRTIGG
jgi:2-succinyl-6-hydroxy-2,4-cyclohexadiene-1-carboxylate synthase